MLKLNKSINGFSFLEVLLITAALIFIIVVGWAVYSHYDKSNASIILQRQQHIDKYVSSLNIENYTNFGNSLYKGGYLSASLYKTTESLTNSYSNGSFSSNPSYATIICVDDIPKAYAYGEVHVNSSATAASVPVEVYAFGTSTPVDYTASWVNTNGSWQLNNVSCGQH